MPSLADGADAQEQSAKGHHAKKGQQNDPSAVSIIGRTAGTLRRRSTMTHKEDPFSKKMKKQKYQDKTSQLNKSSIPLFAEKTSTLSKILEKGKNLLEMPQRENCLYPKPIASFIIERENRFEKNRGSGSQWQKQSPWNRMENSP
jgi:hypothetical protein